VFEVDVHQRLRAFLRAQGQPDWPHHLTMARLVARALRLGRSALIQTGDCTGYCRPYRLSYLASILIWPEPVILVTPPSVQQRLLLVEIPQLQQWMNSSKPIVKGEYWHSHHFQGLMLITPESWLRDRLTGNHQIPPGIPTVLDSIDDIEAWTIDCLTTAVHPQDWYELTLAYPQHTELIRDSRIQLTRLLFQRPINPYGCYIVEQTEQEILRRLYHALNQDDHHQPGMTLPGNWQQLELHLHSLNTVCWGTVDRELGQFSLFAGPADVSSLLSQIWSVQPSILIGGTLDLDAHASLSRHQLGLRDATCVQFPLDRQASLIHLYLPEKLPMPNTPQYQSALMVELRQLFNQVYDHLGLTVVIIGDTPLKQQVAALLAAEFGSRVQMERFIEVAENGILVMGWEFWQEFQSQLPCPRLLVIATLPIPSLENPLVAGRVAYYKQLHQDWFRLYLLPKALNTLQRAIAPLRQQQGIVALLDSRVIHRSYGQSILSVLSPFARINSRDITFSSDARP